MIEPAVVVAGQAAVVVVGETNRWPRRQSVLRSDQEDVPAALVGRGHERDGSAVGRPVRLDIHRAVGDQRVGVDGLPIHHPQLDRIIAIGGVDNAAAVGRPVGLMVVGAGRDLLDVHGARRRRRDRSGPERSLHRDDQLVPVGRPGDRGRTARHLRQIHLPVVVVVRELDLLEHRLALGQDGARGQQQEAADERR